jgi:hypothetical protein
LPFNFSFADCFRLARSIIASLQKNFLYQGKQALIGTVRHLTCALRPAANQRQATGKKIIAPRLKCYE